MAPWDPPLDPPLIHSLVYKYRYVHSIRSVHTFFLISPSQLEFQQQNKTVDRPDLLPGNGRGRRRPTRHARPQP